MSVYKFACPVCGQHITTDSAARITQMECPTCFNNLHVPPPPPAGAPTNLVLTTSVVSNRPPPPKPAEKSAPAPAAKKFPLVPIVAVLVVAALGAGAFILLKKNIRSSQSDPAQTNSVAKKETKAKTKGSGFVPPKDDPNWSLNLAKLKLTDTPAGGRIDGKNFAVEKATLTGGTLTLRQGSGKVADLALTIALAAQQGQDLAGQVLAIEKDVEQAVKVTIRWKNPDDPEKSAQRSFTKGYAMRLAFGEVTGKQISGKIYLCTPDKAHSYVAGTFVADIRKPPAPKTTTTTK